MIGINEETTEGAAGTDEQRAGRRRCREFGWPKPGETERRRERRVHMVYQAEMGERMDGVPKVCRAEGG